MGREVQCACRRGEDSGAVKALLESDEIIVRGPIKLRARLAEIDSAEVDAEGLHFSVGGDQVALLMGATEAELWLQKIKAPPKSLRDKLGLSDEAKAYVVGQVDDTALRSALDGFTATTAARMIIAIARDERQVAAAAEAAKHLVAGATIWIVYEKGKNSVFGETRVRDAMRTLGYVDTKVAAVSARLTASRFSSRKR
jgi:hypothetical protein